MSFDRYRRLFLVLAFLWLFVVIALASINANNQTAACGELQSFINDVTAQTGKKLTAAQASQLIDAATRIRDGLGC